MIKCLLKGIEQAHLLTSHKLKAHNSLLAFHRGLYLTLIAGWHSQEMKKWDFCYHSDYTGGDAEVITCIWVF